MNYFNEFSKSIMELRYSHDVNGRKETWDEIANRVVDNVLGIRDVKKSIKDALKYLISERKFIPGGRFLAQAGREFHQVNNCFTLRAEDTREGWGELTNKATVMLMSGGGIGVDYSSLRPAGSVLKRSGGYSSGPIPLMKVINEVGRGVMSGGKRRSAIWAGLIWNHPDIYEFIKLKDWKSDVKKLKEKNFDFPADMDMTNISVILDKEFFDAFEDDKHPKHSMAEEVYWSTVESMCKTGEPGFSINYKNQNESLRNACTEIVSEDDCDVCCLGSINLANISSTDELEYVTDLSTLFLILGTEYSDLPYSKVKEVREKNRRIGLGLMGIHEWLILNGYGYYPNDLLEKYLSVWKNTSDSSAKKWADELSFAVPVAKRAIAPNGTISIVGGMTTSGIEPIFSVAYQRRYLTPEGWKKQYVIDFVAEKLIENGFNPEEIEDAYTLSLDVKRRIAFQYVVQKYVDNAISSTINLPAYGEPGNDDYKNFGEILYPFLPDLRGITVYPNGSRGGQPLVPVDYKYALKRKGFVFDANEDCSGGICGV